MPNAREKTGWVKKSAEKDTLSGFALCQKSKANGLYPNSSGSRSWRQSFRAAVSKGLVASTASLHRVANQGKNPVLPVMARLSGNNGISP
jgi:hypothetical protein